MYYVVMIFSPWAEPRYLTCRSKKMALRVAKKYLADGSKVVVKGYSYATA